MTRTWRIVIVLIAAVAAVAVAALILSLVALGARDAAHEGAPQSTSAHVAPALVAPTSPTTAPLTWPGVRSYDTCAEVDTTGSWWEPGQAFGGVICDAKIKPDNLATAKRAGA